MFLFEGDFGNILHTGDCRLTPDCLQNLPMKYLANKGREPKCHIDYLFLDCTFAKCSLQFPSKHFAIQQVINCIWNHPDAPLVYLASDLLGQEDILMEIYRTFGTKIWVDKIKHAEYFQALSMIAPDILSLNESSRFQVFEGSSRFYQRAKAKIMEARQNSRPEPLFIRPSAQWYACEEDSEKKEQRNVSLNEAKRDGFCVWHVCFSIHSSKEELDWALQSLRPLRVISTTPPCRAMDLEYVKNNCSNQIFDDDPLWRLLDINPERSTSSEISLNNMGASTNFCSMYKEFPKRLGSIIYKETSSNLHLKSNVRPVTLFGRARFETVIDGEPKSVSTDPESISLQCDNMMDEPILKKSNDDIKICVKESSNIGSSKHLHENLRKFYRSMNVPVPRPLPSLTELVNMSKRVKTHHKSQNCIVNPLDSH